MDCQSLKSVTLFTAIIECNFQNNLCQWTKITTDDSGNFQWIRKNARQLVADNIPGPPKDWDNNDEKFFVIASNALAGSQDPSNVFAKLESPFFKAKQHPIECISFWFYIAVSFEPRTFFYQFIITCRVWLDSRFLGNSSPIELRFLQRELTRFKMLFFSFCSCR